MLNDRILKTAKPKEKPYKIQDRDGMYAYVSTTGNISFRLDYTFNGRRATYTIGKYGIFTLAQAREQVIQLKKEIANGINPADIKKEQRAILENGDTFHAWFTRYMEQADLVISTKKTRLGTYNLYIKREFGNYRLPEITPAHIRHLCEKIKDNGAPASAVFARNIFLQVFKFAILKGIQVSNPAAEIPQSSITRFKARERVLTEKEIHIFLNYLDKSEIYPSTKKGLLLILLTFVRKSELIAATWQEVDFEKKIWHIPATRMKAKRAHNVYLSEQAATLFFQLKILADDSAYIFPARGNPSKHIALYSLNRGILKTLELARKNGIEIADFTVHDLRRTASTLLHEQGYNTDWIEKSLAHEQQGVRAVYNKAEYAEQRKQMMQEWADWIFSLK